MRHLTQQVEVRILILWALMLMHSTADREYVVQTSKTTWDEARNHCKVCFKELVTLTHDNIQVIASKLTSDSWIGLRKYLDPISNSTNNYTDDYTDDYTGNYTGSSSMPWKQWSNGDLLTFQNWYPGQPLFKSPRTKPSCCSCSCTCPALVNPRPTSFTTSQTEFTTQTSFTSVPDLNMTNVTSFTSVPDLNITSVTSFTNVPDLNMTNVTSFTSAPDLNMTNVTSFTSAPYTGEDFTTTTPSLPVEGECVCSTMLLHTDLEPDEDYIEDSCVAMLSFGPWVEKNCSDLLPFICYEDRFIGHINVTKVTCGGASLSWLPAPDGISHYRVEVTGDKQMTEIETNLTTDLFNLTAGTLYSVQVIPVKCERDLNSQEVSFYTVPNKVRNLTVTNVTEKSVFLMWNKPAGNLDFYVIVDDDEKNKRRNTEGIECDGLMSGSLYTFTVHTGVRDNVTLSEGSSISTYTKPGKVANLTARENTNISLLLSWMPPEGHATSFYVQAVDDRNDQFLFGQEMDYNSTQTWQQLKVTGLPMGSRITLSVTALINGTLGGDKVTIVTYTAPGPISNLSLQTTHNSLSATWNPSPGNCTNFTVILQLHGENVETKNRLTEPAVEFSDLKTAANYTVIVSCVSGDLHSPQVKRSKFTLPGPPTDARGVSANKSHITFQWKAPENTVTTQYAVCLSSSFWGYSSCVQWIPQTTYTFGNLKSGTNYTFEVRTVTAEAQSPPLTTSHFTESEEMEIGLSMMCSSTESLLCAKATSEESIILQLHAHFNLSLGNAISWNLKKQEREDAAK